jgi:hypothetical protein
MCQILGNGMSAKIWDATVEHAQTCASGSKHHVYIHQNGLSIIFNNIFQWVAIKENSQSEHRAADSLHHKEKVQGTKKKSKNDDDSHILADFISYDLLLFALFPGQ